VADRRETHLFRIGHEALANIGLHSGASAGEMNLSVEDGFVRLVVMDNGRGMEGEESLGMVGMRTRACQMGAEMFLHKRPSGGLCIAVSVPIELPEEAPLDMKIRVLLADDHAILRKGLRMLLDAQTDLVVVGEARTGREAITKAMALLPDPVLPDPVLPDPVLMDISMPELKGIEGTRQICAAMRGTKVLALSMHNLSVHPVESHRGSVMEKTCETPTTSSVLRCGPV
jgi:CheY-like chemotaxis protein